jgi:pilus assembly protein CpaF
MSLDTYCIGEIIGEESWDFVQAGYTDHRILGTIHGSSVIGAMDRLVMLIENKSRIPYEKLADMIANTIDYVIYLKSFKVVNISSISGFDMEKRQYETKLVYAYGDCQCQ